MKRHHHLLITMCLLAGFYFLFSHLRQHFTNSSKDHTPVIEIQKIVIDPLTPLKQGKTYDQIVSTIPSSGVDMTPPNRFAPSNTIDISYWQSILPSQEKHSSYLVIPRIGMIVPVLQHQYTGDLSLFNQDDLDDAFMSGAVIYPQMAPLGAFGNSLIGGHSSYFLKNKSDYRTIFIRLPELEVGDEVWGYTHTGDNNRQRHRYQVSQSYAMGTFSQDIVLGYPDKKEITLYTCIPIGTDDDRRIIKTSHIASYDLSDVLDHGVRSNTLEKIQQ